MVESLLGLFSDLEKTTDVEEQKELSEYIMSAIVKDKDYSESLIKSQLRFFINLSSRRDISDIFNGDFVNSDSRIYRDSDGSLKVSYRLSFLQRHENFINDLDVDTILLIQDIIKEKKLERIINDITVNCLQIRDGDVENLKEY